MSDDEEQFPLPPDDDDDDNNEDGFSNVYNDNENVTLKSNNDNLNNSNMNDHVSTGISRIDNNLNDSRDATVVDFVADKDVDDIFHNDDNDEEAEEVDANENDDENDDDDEEDDGDNDDDAVKDAANDDEDNDEADVMNIFGNSNKNNDDNDDDNEDDEEMKISRPSKEKKTKKRKLLDDDNKIIQKKTSKKTSIKKTTKKKQSSTRGYNFFNEEADVADDSDEEEDYEDGFVEEILDKDEIAAREAVDRRHELNRDFLSKPAEELALEYELRQKNEARLKRNYRNDNDFISNRNNNNNNNIAIAQQQSILPSILDPKIFKLKIKPGNEILLVRSILKKSIDLKMKGGVLKIKSVFCSSCKGFIYIEALSEAFAKDIIQGIFGFYIVLYCIYMRSYEYNCIYIYDCIKVTDSHHYISL